MAIRGGEYAVARVIAVLKANLPAELDLIDAEEADGLTLEDVADSAYYDYETQVSLVQWDLAIVVNISATSPIEMLSTTNSPGLYDAAHDITVSVHIKNAKGEDPSTMKKRIQRYARAIERVLVIRYPTMPSGGVQTCVSIMREEDVTYVEAEQEEGGDVRSATIPLRIRTRESLV